MIKSLRRCISFLCPLLVALGKILLYSSGTEMFMGGKVSYAEKVHLKHLLRCDKRKNLSSDALVNCSAEMILDCNKFDSGKKIITTMNEPSEADKRTFIKQQYFYRIYLKYPWMQEALTLKLAADRLYWEYKNAHDEFVEWLTSEILAEKIPDGDNFTRDLILNFYKVYFMLIGYAFENLFKGILVSQKPPESDENVFPYGGHSLEKMAEVTNIELEESEKELLKQISEYVKWKGRYAFPLTMNKMPQFDENGVWQEGYSHDDKHKIDVDNLFYKVIDILSLQKNLFKNPDEILK